MGYRNVFALLVLFISSLGSNSFARNIYCTPKVLEFVLSDFQEAKKTGLIVKPVSGDEMNLGTDIETTAVTVKDIGKAFYWVEILVEDFGPKREPAIIRAEVKHVNYETCEIEPQKVSYVLFLKRFLSPVR